MRGSKTQCRVMKRCLVKCLIVFSAVSLLPFALIYLISTEQINRIKNYEVSFQIIFVCIILSNPKFGNNEYDIIENFKKDSRQILILLFMNLNTA